MNVTFLIRFYNCNSQRSIMSINKFEPRANAFLFVNLGCEMLYVIDQRLQAQQITKDKAIKVLNDITAVMFETKFIDSLIVGSTHVNSQLLTVEHCKFMLNDIAICSLMRLDTKSMDKLWNLMTGVFRWQMFVARRQHHLLDITFRHLDGVLQLHVDEKHSLLIDITKNTLLDFWNACNEETQMAIYHTIQSWLQNFNTKISLLIRLGFQNSADGTLNEDVDQDYNKEFLDTIGVNIYEKSNKMSTPSQPNTEGIEHNDHLITLLYSQQTNNEDLRPINASDVQKKFEWSLQQCNILFNDIDSREQHHQSSTINSVDTLDFNILADTTQPRNSNSSDIK